MNTRALAWRLHWYRQSELEGALLLGRMVRLASSDELCARLTRHCADEARHSLLWSKAIGRLRLPYVRILRSYQSFYGAVPATLAEVLAFTQIFERRVHRQFTLEACDPDTPEEARRTFQVMIDDEKDHLAWVRDWLEEQPESAALLGKYEAIDARVYREIEPYTERLWEIDGLGRESEIYDQYPVLECA
jgi:hypothetical protein